MDATRLERARQALGDFGTLWRNPAVSPRLREEALLEIVERIDIDGPEIIAVHPRENEHAWLLGAASLRTEQLHVQQCVGVVGARGVAPP